MSRNSHPDVVIVGAGLAGSQAALTCARHGLHVHLYEMRPEKKSPAHHSDYAAELVCSNSLKSDVCINAAGLLKRELTLLGSEVLAQAYHHRVPAGGALAVDREEFSESVDDLLSENPRITRINEEFDTFDKVPDGIPVIIAAGPLCSDKLSEALAPFVGDSMNFYDAAAPIVQADSLDESRVFSASRYGKGEGDDYLNVALDQKEYDVFYNALVNAERVNKKEFEKNDLFNACQPLEEIARKGYDALRYGVMKPVGIDDPRTGRWPFALVQLRTETRHRHAYNLVGFQTNLTWSEQKRVFRLLPGLQNVEFERYGVMHRNTFINAPEMQRIDLSLKNAPLIYLAGQITGTEGYTEAIASGLLAGLNVVARIKGLTPFVLPEETVLGSLMKYAHDETTVDYQPMHVNFGIMTPLENRVRNKRERYKHYALRSMKALEEYKATYEEKTFFAPDFDDKCASTIEEIVTHEIFK